MKSAHLRDLSAADPARWQHFHVEHDTWLLDISRQRVTRETLSLLLDLARATDLAGRIAAMFRGDAINTTERRAVLHTGAAFGFRRRHGRPVRRCANPRQKLAEFVAAVRRGEKRGTTGKPFKHVINIGIGGSDLGPLLVCDALRHEMERGHHAAFRVERRSHPTRGSR